MAIDAGASVGIFHEAAMTMTSPAHPRVLIIDDDLLVAETFLYALTQSGFSVRLVVPATVEQLEFGLGWDPHVALLDVDLVAGDPVSFVDQMRRSGVPVAVMGSEGKQEALLRCGQAGAALVIPPNMPLEELIRMLGTVVEGSKIESPPPETATMPSQDWVPPVQAGLHRDIFAILTQREQKVLIGLMDGRTDEEIARRERAEVSTVRSQIRRVLQKLGVNSQLAAVAFARQAGWAGGGGGPMSSPASVPPRFASDTLLRD
jgi:DNA-binding NarL/FixJ family response regulator